MRESSTPNGRRADGPTDARGDGARVAGRSSLWRRRALRWALPLLGLAVVALSMASVVRRGGEARRLSREIGVLRRAEDLTRERLREVRRRADSLASRPRIRSAAARLGLRPASDREIVFLLEPAAGPSRPSEEGTR